MVTVFLRGGLGNQMFQYAAGLAAAKKRGTGLVLDTVFLNDRFPRKEFSYRTYDLDIFAMAPRFTPLSECSRRFPVPGFWLGIDLAFMWAGNALGIRPVIKEKQEFVVDPEVLASGKNAVLLGRWQSENYFTGIEGDIRKAFEFRDPITGEAAAIAGSIRSSNSVSVHVRRGDFVSFKSVEKLMGATDTGYFDRAAAYVATQVPGAKFFVFSDDIEWCKEHLPLPHGAVYVPASAEGPKAAFHLHLMSLCKHNIVANSTFSWWGAWLNQNPHKIVVAPKNWYADGRDKENKIMPVSWIKM